MDRFSKKESKGNDRCTPGKIGYTAKDGTSVICIGNDVQTTVPYNPQTILSGSSNSNSNIATYQPHTPNLGSGNLFGSSGSGYVGVAESHSMHNQYGGIHATGGGIHGKYVEPIPQEIQPVQTVAVSKPQPVVQKQVFIPKPVLTQKEIQAEKIARAEYYAAGARADAKAKAITKMIVVTQAEEHVKVLNLDNAVLTRGDTCQLGYDLTKVSFDLDVISLKNAKFALETGLPDMLSLDYFMGIFHNLNQGISHNVVYLNLTNTCANFYTGDSLAQKISKALVSGDLNATKAINLSGNKITDKGVKEIAEAMKTGNFNLEQFNLSGNKVTNEGAYAIGEALETGKVNNLKYLDVSDNEGITAKGEGFLIKAVEETPNDSLNITFVSTSKHFTKQDSIGKHAIKYALKTFLSHAKENGVDVDYVTTNKETVDYLYDVGKTSGRLLLGYGKCAYKVVELVSLDFNAASLAVDGVIEYSGNKVAKKLNFWACLGMESYDAILTPEGADLAVKGLELIGDNE